MATEDVGMEAVLQRLIVVERELSDIKRRLEVRDPDRDAWYLKHAGTFKDDPEFDEAVRLGREIRSADRPE